jgi:hypothetical protein
MAKCSIEGCEKDAVARGFCQTHYMRWRKHGDATKVSRVALKGKSLRERFDCQAVKKYGCWDWIGHKDKKGYGRILVEGKIQLAHRVSWELANGPVPNGLLVLHRCDNPSCTNPEHLFVGTQKDNIDDMVNKGRDRRGHPILKGIANGATFLSDDDVYAIREWNGSLKEAAAHYRISYGQIWNIRTRRSWKHLPERNTS